MSRLHRAVSPGNKSQIENTAKDQSKMELKYIATFESRCRVSCSRETELQTNRPAIQSTLPRNLSINWTLRSECQPTICRASVTPSSAFHTARRRNMIIITGLVIIQLFTAVT